MEVTSSSTKDVELYSLIGVTISLLLYTLISVRAKTGGTSTLVCAILAAALSANAPFLLNALSTLQVPPKVMVSLVVGLSLAAGSVALLLLFFTQRNHTTPLFKKPSLRQSSLSRSRVLKSYNECVLCTEWCHVPESIMSEILRKVSQEDIRSIRMVCRDWYNSATQSLESLYPIEFHPEILSKDFPLLRKLNLSQCVEDIDFEGLKVIGQSLIHLTEVNLGRHHNLIASTITDQCLVQLMPLLKIRTLKLAQCVHITDHGLFQIAQNLKLLEDLNISGCVGVTDYGVEKLTQLPALQILEMPWCLKISDYSIKALTSNLTKLRKLNISGCQLITDSGISLIGEFKNLEDLNLLYTGYSKICVTDESLAKLSELKKMRRLSLGGMRVQHTRVSDHGMKTIVRNHPALESLCLMWLDISNEGVSCLTELQNLTELSLRGCARVSEKGIKYIGQLNGIKELNLLQNPQLNLTDEVLEELSPLIKMKSLSLGDAHQGNLLTDDGMSILSTFSNLQTLNLSYFQWQFAGSGLGPLLTLHSLENLDFSGSNNVNDSTLSVIGMISSIKTLQLSKCGLISSTGLKHLIHLHSLHTLSLAGCFRIDDHGLEHLSNIPSLNSLILSQCHIITDSGIRHLRKLHKLSHLDLFGCREIRGEGFDGFRDLPIKTLNVSDCPYLLDEALNHIGKIHTLAKLDMIACISVTDHGIGSLTDLTNLTGLDVSMCGRLGDASMLALSKLPRLTTFKLSGCDMLTDLGVSYLSKQTGLLAVHLDRCHTITDQALLHLGQCQSLTSLRLAICPRITDVGVGYLASLPKLSIFDLVQCPFVTQQGFQALTNLTNLATLGT